MTRPTIRIERGLETTAVTDSTIPGDSVLDIVTRREFGIASYKTVNIGGLRAIIEAVEDNMRHCSPSIRSQNHVSYMLWIWELRFHYNRYDRNLSC
jgi:hypothetical protein